mgnify:FL=1
MTRNYIPGIDDEYKFTRPEYAKLLGISSNALRMKMRKGGFGDEYVIKDGKYLFKRPGVSKEERPGKNVDPYQVIKEKNYTYKKPPVKRGTHFENNYTSDALRKHNEYKMYNKIKKNLTDKELDEINPEVMQIARDRANERRKKALKIKESFDNYKPQRHRIPIPIEDEPYSSSYFIGRAPYDPPPKEEPVDYVWYEPKTKDPGSDYKEGKFKFLDEAIRNAKKK